MAYFLEKKEIHEANKTASFIVLIFIAIAAILAVFTSINANQVASLLGASGDYHKIATMYLRYLSIAFFPQMISVVLDGLVMNDGNPKYNFRVNMITLAMNVVLNMIFFVIIFKQGVIGLAVATLISHSYHLIADIYYLAYKSNTIKKIKMPTKNYQALKRVLYNGSSDFLGVFIEAIMIYVVNLSILKFLPNEYLEAYAASAVFTLFIAKIYLGSQYGLQPISSNLMGQEKYDELRQLFLFSVKRSALYALGFFYIILIPVARFGLPYFLDNPQLVNIAFILYLQVGFAIVLSNIGIQSSVFFTAINRPIESLVIAVIRTLILIPVCIYTMIWIFEFIGIVIGFLIPEILMTIGFMYYFKRLDLSRLKV